MRQKKSTKLYSEATGICGYHSKTITQKLHFIHHYSTPNMNNAFLVSSFFNLFKIQVTSLSSYNSWVNHISNGAKTCLSLISSLRILPTAFLPSHVLKTYVLKSIFYQHWELHSLLIKWTTHNNSFYFVWFSPNCTYYFQHTFTGPVWHAWPKLLLLGTKSTPNNQKEGFKRKSHIGLGIHTCCL